MAKAETLCFGCDIHFPVLLLETKEEVSRSQTLGWKVRPPFPNSDFAGVTGVILCDSYEQAKQRKEKLQTANKD